MEKYSQNKAGECRCVRIEIKKMEKYSQNKAAAYEQKLRKQESIRRIRSLCANRNQENEKVFVE